LGVEYYRVKFSERYRHEYVIIVVTIEARTNRANIAILIRLIREK
jgi:hypothetical protein